MVRVVIITADSSLLRPKLDCEGGYDVAMKGPSVVVLATTDAIGQIFLSQPGQCDFSSAQDSAESLTKLLLG
jgi:hypothetical protein